MNEANQVEFLAKRVGQDWKESAYYDIAEEQIAGFWDPARTFRPLFDRMPLGTVLDLACGHGRHINQLLQITDHIIGMDINAENIEFCGNRFGDQPKLKLIHGTGASFQPVEDDSVDSIVCYDSMVHFDCEVVRSYLIDAHRVLRPGGMGVFHHSNFDAAPAAIHYGQNPHARNFMSKQLFAHYTYKAGLELVDQVVIPWGEDADLDCISLIKAPSA